MFLTRQLTVSVLQPRCATSVFMYMYFLRRLTRIDCTADNADITLQLQAANNHRLLSHVTQGLIECRK